MLVRLNIDTTDTDKLLGAILTEILRGNNRVAVLCAAGDGFMCIARLRAMLTRRKQRLKSRGKLVKQFRFRTSVHPETHNGIRYDCLVAWSEYTESAWLNEQYDLLVSGA